MTIREGNTACVTIFTPDRRPGGRLHFIPHDAGLLLRAMGAQKRLRRLFEPLCNVRMTSDGRGCDAQSEAVIRAAEEQFRSLVDEICGIQTSDAAFERFSPFASMPGDTLWAESVIDALDTVNKTVEKNLKRLNRKLNWR